MDGGGIIASGTTIENNAGKFYLHEHPTSLPVLLYNMFIHCYLSVLIDKYSNGAGYAIRILYDA